MHKHKRGFYDAEGYSYARRKTPLPTALMEPALLFLIKNMPQHGYALHSSLKDLGIYPVHPSIVYRTLRQMEAMGWIKAEWDVDNVQGPPRKLFSLTEEGRIAYLTWREELTKAQEIIQILVDQRG